MRTLVRLLILALLAHAAFRAGQAALTFYEVRDEVEEVARGVQPQDSDAEVQQRVAEAAARAGVALEPAAVVVERDGDRVSIAAGYAARVELLPRYFYPWRFRFTVDNSAGPLTRTIRPIR